VPGGLIKRKKLSGPTTSAYFTVDPLTRMFKSSKTEYLINGKRVSKDKYDRKMASLLARNK
jgi:hypothetical protein